MDMHEMMHWLGIDPADDRNTRARVDGWAPNAAVANPEELGHYLQGDLLFRPRRRARNGVIDSVMQK